MEDTIRPAVIPDSRLISALPPAYSRQSTPYTQAKFSPACERFAAKSRIATASRLAKMIIIGDCGVGKTCLVNRFCRGAFDANYKATIGVDFELERFKILDTVFNLQIWDTAGQERFKCIAKSYYRDANVIAIVFDMTDPKTLVNATRWLTDAQETNPAVGSKYPPAVFLIGTKKDLLSDANPPTVSEVFAQASAVASKMRAELWLVSSKVRGQTSVVSDLFLRMAAMAFDTVMSRAAAMEAEGNATQIGGVESLKLSLNEADLYEKKQSHCVGTKCNYS